jgi:hypothetical protein
VSHTGGTSQSPSRTRRLAAAIKSRVIARRRSARTVPEVGLDDFRQQVLEYFPGCEEPELTERAELLQMARRVEQTALESARREHMLPPTVRTVSRRMLRWLGTLVTLTLAGVIAALVTGLLPH